ncbi:MAG: hypothetical protein HFI67_00365 [Lachnospiraceae bacterium]|nr:hypothetical protein [Lachnospiraceae bacterium]
MRRKSLVFFLIVALLCQMLGSVAYAETVGENVETGTVEETQKPAPQSETPEDQYDITKPVIERVEFPQQGKTLKEGDTLQLYVYAYDADSEIESVSLQMQSDNVDFNSTLSYNETEKRYEFEDKLDEVGTGKVYISEIKVTDSFGNCTDANLWENGDYVYWFNVEAKALRVTAFEFEQDGQTLDTEAALSLTLETDPSVTDESLYLTVKESDGGSRHTFSLNREGGNRYVGKVPSHMGDGVWRLESISLSRSMHWLELQVDAIENFGFTVKKSSGENPDPTPEIVFPEIASVELEKNGEILRAGDTAAVTVKMKPGVEMQENGSAYFRAIAGDLEYEKSRKTVDLKYDELDNAYHGTFVVDTDTYPCEWYIESVSVQSEDGHYAMNNYSLFTNQPYYVQVYNGNTFSNPTYEYTVRFHVRDVDGEWKVAEEQKLKGERRQTLKEAGLVFPEMNSTSGMKQVGWEANGHTEEITENTKVVDHGSQWDIYAKYDKVRFFINYRYTNQNGEIANKKEMRLVDNGISCEEFVETLEYRPEDIGKDYSFEGWDLVEWYYSGTQNEKDKDVACVARYAEKNLVQVEAYYYDINGYYTHQEALFVDKEATKEEIESLLKKQAMPKMYPGLRFKEWSIIVEQYGDGPVKNGIFASKYAVYTNHMVRCLIDPRCQEEDFFYQGISDQMFEAMFCQVVEPGAEFVLPKALGDYSNITWVRERDDEISEENVYVVNQNMDFYGYGTKQADPSTPEKPEEPDTPEKPTEPVVPEKPGLSPEKLSDAKIAELVKRANDAAPQEVIIVDMKEATVVPAQLLKAAKGKNLTIQMNMGGYIWSIDGRDILAEEPKDVNMQVILDTQHIPSATIRALAGNSPVRQLSLVHEGDFGFKATLTINIGKKYAGLYGNLYYHDSAGKLVFIHAGKIGGDGVVSLTFSHASDYLIVISAQRLDKNNAKGPQTPDQKDVSTGDTNHMLPWVISGLAAIGVMTLLMQKQYRKKRH